MDSSVIVLITTIAGNGAILTYCQFIYTKLKTLDNLKELHVRNYPEDGGLLK
jgi:hypothetical protein